jgi:hypothetical protein
LQKVYLCDQSSGVNFQQESDGLIWDEEVWSALHTPKSKKEMSIAVPKFLLIPALGDADYFSSYLSMLYHVHGAEDGGGLDSWVVVAKAAQGLYRKEYLAIRKGVPVPLIWGKRNSFKTELLRTWLRLCALDPCELLEGTSTTAGIELKMSVANGGCTAYDDTQTKNKDGKIISQGMIHWSHSGQAKCLANSTIRAKNTFASATNKFPLSMVEAASNDPEATLSRICPIVKRRRLEMTQIHAEALKSADESPGACLRFLAEVGKPPTDEEFNSARARIQTMLKEQDPAVSRSLSARSVDWAATDLHTLKQLHAYCPEVKLCQVMDKPIEQLRILSSISNGELNKDDLCGFFRDLTWLITNDPDSVSPAGEAPWIQLREKESDMFLWVNAKIWTAEFPREVNIPEVKVLQAAADGRLILKHVR